MAFKNLHSWLSQLIDVFQFSALMNSLALDGLVHDVVYAFNKDLMSQSNLFGYMASGE